MSNSHTMRCLIVLLTVLGAAATSAPGQMHDDDANAVAAFQELLDWYRNGEARHVTVELAIETERDGAKGDGRASTAEFLLLPERRGTIDLRGFHVLVDDGKITVVHEGTDHAYLDQPDTGSPFYALLTAFLDLPYPHIAMGFGAQKWSDVCMQLHPQTPWLRPTGVEEIVVDGADRRRITLSSDFAVMHIDIDTEAKIVTASDVTVTGGQLVPANTTVRYVYTFENETPDAADVAAAMAFDPESRQRVDAIGSLLPKVQPAPPAPAGDPGGAAGGLLAAGTPAPDILLATADGDAVDLEELRGRVVVIDFWASWCGPCMTALPVLHDVADWAQEGDLPVVVLTVNVFERAAPGEDAVAARKSVVAETWKKHGFTLPVLLDYTDASAQAYQVQGIPATFVIRADGVIQDAHSGFSGQYENWLKSTIEAAMAEAPQEL